NKCDRLDDRARARVGAVYPGALCVSALNGQGRDDLIAAIEGRLGLDTTLVKLEFASGNERDRERISQLYRVGRILSHVATDDRISIEAEVPRRLVDHLASAAIRKGRRA
ncbi:MAG: hypothetical protein ABIP65_06535, partial [Vicinamibacterales bacterium]